MKGGPLKKEGDGKYNLLQYHFHWGKDENEGQICEMSMFSLGLQPTKNSTKTGKILTIAWVWSQTNANNVKCQSNFQIVTILQFHV